MSINVAEVLNLPAAERLQLVETLWDSLAATPDVIELTDAQRAELDRRLAAFEKDGQVGDDWETVRARILSRQ